MRYSYVLILGAVLAATSFSPLLACNCGIQEISPEVVADWD